MSGHEDTAAEEWSEETARARDERVAPWLVFMSRHLPEVHMFDGVPAIGCMCGATRTLYVGHLARMLAGNPILAARDARVAAGARADALAPILALADWCAVKEADFAATLRGNYDAYAEGSRDAYDLVETRLRAATEDPS